VNVTVAPLLEVASTVIAAGTVTTGAGFWTTVTVNDADPDTFCGSVAVQVTVVLPTGNTAPDAHVQTGVSGPVSTSLAVAVYVTAMPDDPGDTTLNDAGTVTVGG
jgi:hypothetical protein